MKKSEITATFSSNIEKVWNIIIDNSNYTWRSELDKIIVSEDGKSFVEYTHDGFETEFAITHKEPFKRYEFDMNNKNMNGHWTGIFSPSGTGTQIVFTEEVSVKNPIMNLFVSIYLKKQQNTYVSNLQKALGE